MPARKLHGTQGVLAQYNCKSGTITPAIGLETYRSTHDNTPKAIKAKAAEEIQQPPEVAQERDTS